MPRSPVLSSLNPDMDWNTVYTKKVAHATNKLFSFDNVSQRGIYTLKGEIHRLFDPLWQKRGLSEVEKQQLRTFFYEVIAAILEEEDQTVNGWVENIHMGSLSTDISEKLLRKFRKLPVAIFWLKEVDKNSPKSIKDLKLFWNKNISYDSRKNNEFIVKIRNKINGVEININEEIEEKIVKKDISTVTIRKETIIETGNVVKHNQKVKNKNGKRSKSNKKNGKQNKGDNLTELLDDIVGDGYVQYFNLKTKAEICLNEIRPLVIDAQDKRIELNNEEDKKTLQKLLKQLQDIYEQILNFEHYDDLCSYGYFWEWGLFESNKNKNLRKAANYYLQAYEKDTDKNKELLGKIVAIVYNLTEAEGRLNITELNKQGYRKTLEDIRKQADKIKQTVSNGDEKKVPPELVYLITMMRYFTLFYVKGVIGAGTEKYIRQCMENENFTWKKSAWESVGTEEKEEKNGDIVIEESVAKLCESDIEGCCNKKNSPCSVKAYPIYKDETGKSEFLCSANLPIAAVYYYRKNSLCRTGYIDASICYTNKEAEGTIKEIAKELTDIIYSYTNVVINIGDKNAVLCSNVLWYGFIRFVDSFICERNAIVEKDKNIQESFYDDLEKRYKAVYKEVYNKLKRETHNSFAVLAQGLMHHNSLLSGAYNLGEERFILAYLYYRKAKNMGNDYAKRFIALLEKNHGKIIEECENELNKYLKGEQEDKILYKFYEQITLWLGEEKEFFKLGLSVEEKEASNVIVNITSANKELKTYQNFKNDLTNVFKTLFSLGRKTDNFGRAVRAASFILSTEQKQLA